MTAAPMPLAMPMGGPVNVGKKGGIPMNAKPGYKPPPNPTPGKVTAPEKSVVDIAPPIRTFKPDEAKFAPAASAAAAKLQGALVEDKESAKETKPASKPQQADPEAKGKSSAKLVAVPQSVTCMSIINRFVNQPHAR